MVFSAHSTVRGRPGPHPADHSVEGDELLDLWLVAGDGVAICFDASTIKAL
jgi:hypothetical protein